MERFSPRPAIIKVEGERSEPPITKQQFDYVLNFGNLAAGNSATVNLQVESNSDFSIIKSMFWAELNGAAAQPTVDTFVQPNLNVLMNDSGSNRNLSSAAINISSKFGTAQRPYIWPLPMILRANSTLSVTVTNAAAAAQYNNIQLVFSGFKLFYPG